MNLFPSIASKGTGSSREPQCIPHSVKYFSPFLTIFNHFILVFILNLSLCPSKKSMDELRFRNRPSALLDYDVYMTLNYTKTFHITYMQYLYNNY